VPKLTVELDASALKEKIEQMDVRQYIMRVDAVSVSGRVPIYVDDIIGISYRWKGSIELDPNWYTIVARGIQSPFFEKQSERIDLSHTDKTVQINWKEN